MTHAQKMQKQAPKEKQERALPFSTLLQNSAIIKQRFKQKQVKSSV